MRNIINYKMKCLCLIMTLNIGSVQAQPQQGLISRLIEIKYSTELYLTTQIKNETNLAKKIVHLRYTIPCDGK